MLVNQWFPAAWSLRRPAQDMADKPPVNVEYSVMGDVFAILYTIAVGVVAGGIIGSVHQLYADRRPSFTYIPDGTLAKLWTVFVLLFCGPLIIMRNAIRARILQHRSPGWLAATTAIATGWSFVSGVTITSSALAIAAQLAA